MDDRLAARIAAKTIPGPDGCLLWTGRTSGNTQPQIEHNGVQYQVRRLLFRERHGWLPGNLGYCPAGGKRCVNVDHVPPAAHALPKLALRPGPRRLRELGALAMPAPGRAVSDVVACPDCGGPMTGFEPVIDRYRVVGCDPMCLACAGIRTKIGGVGGQKPKYALDPSPRRLRDLADRVAVARFVARERPALIVPVATILVPVDLWLFEERPIRGGTLRQRIAERNRELWREEAEGRLAG